MASQPDLRPNGWLTVPWAHLTTGHGASDGTDAALGFGQGNQATFPIIVNTNEADQAVTEILGTQRFTGTGFLNRTLPKQHPLFNWLYASRITSYKPMKWVGKAFLGTGNWSLYDYVMLSILFQQPKYPVLSDTGLDRAFPPVVIDGTAYRQEWLRFTERTPTVAGDILTLEAGSLTFAEGAGAPAPTAGTTKLQTPVGQPITAGDFVLLWRNVPIRGLFSPTTFRPENLIAAANTVNKAAFLGYPVGTLLFAGATFAYNEAPYPPGTILLGGPEGDLAPEALWPSLTVDVTLVFKFKDPPPGGATRGWNLQPWRGNGSVSDLKWYLATVDGNPVSTPMLPTYDFRKMFAESA